MRYIMIMEDNSIFKIGDITQSDKDAADNGILDIIDTKTMKVWYDDKWNDIKKAEG